MKKYIAFASLGFAFGLLVSTLAIQSKLRDMQGELGYAKRTIAKLSQLSSPPPVAQEMTITPGGHDYSLTLPENAVKSDFVVIIAQVIKDGPLTVECSSCGNMQVAEINPKPTIIKGGNHAD